MCVYSAELSESADGEDVCMHTTLCPVYQTQYWKGEMRQSLLSESAYMQCKFELQYSGVNMSLVSMLNASWLSHHRRHGCRQSEACETCHIL